MNKTRTDSGTNTGDSRNNTETMISSTTTLLNRRKRREGGFEKSSRILIGKKIGVGEM